MHPQKARADGPPPIVAAVYVSGNAGNFVPAVAALARDGVPIVLGAASDQVVAPLRAVSGGAKEIVASGPAALVNRIWSESRTNIALIADAVSLPPEVFAHAVSILESDLRVSTISFFSNAASFLSFPVRNQPGHRVTEGHDERSITRLLRTRSPEPAPAPTPVPAGPVTVFSSGALSATGLLDEDPSITAEAAAAGFAMRALRKGFVSILDPGTFYAHTSDLTVHPRNEMLGDGSPSEASEWLARSHPLLGPALRDAVSSEESPLSLAFGCARAKVCGLRLILDGSCFGPQETGVQVVTLALIRALCAHDEVAEVQVVVPAVVPAYAREVLSHPKVLAYPAPRMDLSGLRPADVAHRPFQPDQHFRPEEWRRVAARLIASVHDLIAYQIAGYHESDDHWLSYRAAMREALRRLDGLVVGAPDVVDQIRLESLPAEPSRVFVVADGTDHLTGAEDAEMPAELVARGFAAGEFLLTLGTNYTHKNREIAIRTQRTLKERGWNLALVLAGASVPFGASRAEEAMEAAGGGDDVYIIPDVSPPERHWLLRHASAVLYSTSAEGFGLLPFEAARFGTPAVAVGFGPMKRFSALPVVPRDWEASSLATSVEELLRDPATSREQISATLAAAQRYTWASAAEELVRAYRALLALPARDRPPA